MRTRKAPQYGLRSATRFARAAAFCVATSAVAQVSSPKRDAPPPGPPTSGSVVSFQESRSAGIVYHEQKGGLVSSVGSPVKLDQTPVAAAKPAPAAAPPAAAGKVAQASAAPNRARP